MKQLNILQSPSPNCNERRNEMSVSMLVLHYTGMQTAEGALRRMCDVDAGVSAHYMITEEGLIHQLVAEDKRAWHAGVSYWNGITDVNSASIGIEIVNPGHEFGYVPFPEEQMLAVKALSQQIVNRYEIEPLNVVGHSDIAPKRKQDPGELFDWEMLAAVGVGYWPAHNASGEQMSRLALDEALEAIGYEDPGSVETIAAFQRHWRPSVISGEEDPETLKLAQLVAAQRNT
ncbi:N-acetylmuramoyl-L-alanine amidase [Sneathiella limimaris]|uniref:N-acetylmuramoyl-L-alanine amidase n=1 Tax=Sneathiella limimaris TaxID=1964213 RepID=UPI00146EF2CA|nr:N-acetylmuramoyl-L-alanine amidase [Sneathiella limimaris]